MAETIPDRSAQAFRLDIHPISSRDGARSLADIAREVAEIFVADVEGQLRERLALSVIDAGIHSALISALEQRLRGMLAANADAEKSRDDFLPVENLKPSEIIHSGRTQLSIASLYRYIDQGRFYCLRRPGQANNRLLPAWQFIDPVPELLPGVLAALRGSSSTEVHAFLVTARDELNALAPAEILAGKSFKGNERLHPSQSRLLKRMASERLGRVLAIVDQEEGGAFR